MNLQDNIKAVYFGRALRVCGLRTPTGDPRRLEHSTDNGSLVGRYDNPHFIPHTGVAGTHSNVRHAGFPLKGITR